MGTDVSTYRIRIGQHNARLRTTRKQKESGSGNLVEFFVSIVLAILLIIGGIESNPGPTETEYDIVRMFEEIRSGQDKCRQDLHNLVRGIGVRMDEMERNINEFKKEQQRRNEEYEEQMKAWRRWQAEERRNNLIIFGLQESGAERGWGICTLVLDFLARELSLNIGEHSVKNAFRIGKGGNRPILVKFCSRFTKEFVMSKSYMLKGTKVRFENDYDVETRQIRRQLLPYLKDARSHGHKAYLRGSKLNVSGKLYDLDFFIRNHDERVTQRRNEGLRTRTRSESPFRSSRDPEDSYCRGYRQQRKETEHLEEGKSNKSNPMDSLIDEGSQENNGLVKNGHEDHEIDTQNMTEQISREENVSVVQRESERRKETQWPMLAKMAKEQRRRERGEWVPSVSTENHVKEDQRKRKGERSEARKAEHNYDLRKYWPKINTKERNNKDFK